MEKKELQLQPRLQCLADLVPQGARLADVGTDHGYLPVWLLQRGRMESAIASDINALPLDHARATAAEYGVTACIDFRLCPGLAKIGSEECDTVAIAGMGGETIIAILESAPWTKDGAHTLLLRPMTKAAELRRWLSVNGYAFTEKQQKKNMIYLYPVLRVNGGICPALTELQTLTGVLLDGDPLYADYLTQHAEKLLHIAEGLRRSGREDALHQAEAAEAMAQQIEEKRKTL